VLDVEGNYRLTIVKATESGSTTHVRIPSPLGELAIVSRNDAITGVYFENHLPAPREDRFGAKGVEVTGIVEEASRQLGEYFAGERRIFDLPIAVQGDPLEERIWAIVRETPYGDTVTYGEIARRLGDGTTARDVGGAMGRNPVCILVACHRVIGAGGKLTGYAGGLERKAYLLDLERDVVGHAERLF
jgi:methylated-DNA-[protein]-cysteine S-methyltransferase